MEKKNSTIALNERRHTSKTLETGDRSYVMLYFNAYEELRCMMVSANSMEEVEEIASARGIKPAGIISAKKIITSYERKKK